MRRILSNIRWQRTAVRSAQWSSSLKLPSCPYFWTYQVAVMISYDFCLFCINLGCEFVKWRESEWAAYLSYYEGGAFHVARRTMFCNTCTCWTAPTVTSNHTGQAQFWLSELQPSRRTVCSLWKDKIAEYTSWRPYCLHFHSGLELNPFRYHDADVSNTFDIDLSMSINR